MQYADGSVHTAGIEAKSLRTKHDLRGRCATTTLAAASVAVALATGLAVWRETNERIGARLGVGAGLIAGLILGLIFLAWARRSPRFRDHAVLAQVARYPAGERWLAVTKDFTDREEAAYEALVASCRHEGVGQLVVDRRRNVMAKVEAVARGRIDTLGEYRCEAAIRATLREARPGSTLRSA